MSRKKRKNNQLSKNQQQSTLVSQSRTTINTFEGPIPPPEVLAGYNELYANAAEQLINNAIAQSKHRMEMEAIVIRGSVKHAEAGLQLGTFIIVVAIAGAVIIAATGHELLGFAAFITALLSGVGTYWFGVRQQRQDLAKKSKQRR